MKCGLEILIFCMRLLSGFKWMWNVTYEIKCMQVVSDRKWHKQLKELRCTSYLTYLMNSCQGASHNGVLISNCDLFIHALAERKARPQANQRSALCSRPHCSHLSHWLYKPTLLAARRAPCPLPTRPNAYIHSFRHDSFIRGKTHIRPKGGCHSLR